MSFLGLTLNFFCGLRNFSRTSGWAAQTIRDKGVFLGHPILHHRPAGPLYNASWRGSSGRWLQWPACCCWGHQPQIRFHLNSVPVQCDVWCLSIFLHSSFFSLLPSFRLFFFFDFSFSCSCFQFEMQPTSMWHLVKKLAAFWTEDLLTQIYRKVVRKGFCRFCLSRILLYFPMSVC